MVRKLLMALSLALLFTICPIDKTNNSLAYSEENLISPLWDKSFNSSVYATSSGNNIILEANISSRNISSSINGSLYLEKYTNGRWVTETSWVLSGRGSLISTKRHYGATGTRYRARLRVTVNGETSTAYSSSIQL